MVDAVVVDVIRTASGRGKPGGVLSSTHPATLLAGVLEALVARTGIDPALIDDVITGCVTQAGDQAVNIGRTAVLAAGLPESVPAVTIDRQCGSSQQALQFAAQAVMSGTAEIVIACGVESMSRSPMGYAERDGQPTSPLAVRYPDGLVNQGVAAELIARRWGISRVEMDEFAAASHQRATAAQRSGSFESEIVSVDLPDGKTHTLDETVRTSTSADQLSTLGASFRTDEHATRFPEIEWSITPGNSSPLTDGASAALVMSSRRAQELQLRPRARIRSFVATGSDPFLMLTGVVPATHKVLDRSGLSLGDIGVYEVNEAFASVPLAWEREFSTERERLNPRGGAIALGHPLGASGVRILATMVNTLESTGQRFGLQTMCEGGGMANALIVESIN